MRLPKMTGDDEEPYSGRTSLCVITSLVLEHLELDYFGTMQFFLTVELTQIGNTFDYLHG